MGKKPLATTAALFSLLVGQNVDVNVFKIVMINLTILNTI
jgi:hypothetical protein